MIKRALLVVLVLLCACRLDAAGLKGVIADYIDAVDHRVAVQPLVGHDAGADAQYREWSDLEEKLETQLQGVFRGDDDIADVAMGYLAQADIGDALLYFRGMIPSDSSAPNAQVLLVKMKTIELQRRHGHALATHHVATACEPSLQSGRQSTRAHTTVARPEGPSPDLPPDLAKFEQIADHKPTYYVTTREIGFPTTGVLFGHNYDGTERKTIQTPTGDTIAETSGRYFASLCMEGSGVISDGRTVSFASNQRFYVTPKGCLGITATGYWVVPFHTLAVNHNEMPYRGVYFIPGTRGLKLPNGEIHDGYWFAHDTGSAFTSTGRFDMYVDTDANWHWMEANFVPSFTPIKVYKVDDATKTKVYSTLR